MLKIGPWRARISKEKKKEKDPVDNIEREDSEKARCDNRKKSQNWKGCIHLQQEHQKTDFQKKQTNKTKQQFH